MNAERLINHLPQKVTLGLSGFLVAATVAGCGEITVTNKPTYAPSLLPPPTDTLRPTTAPTATPTLEITPTPEPTPTPAPTADPNVKCDPRRVPDSQTIVPFNSELPKDFELHVPILEYHLIDTLSGGIAQTDQTPASSSLVVSPENFRQQMKILHDNGWHTITMAQLAKAWVTRTPLDTKTFVVTFDDGYKDGYINALPILEEFGFVGTFYDITNRTGNSANLSRDELIDMTKKGNDIGNHSKSHFDGTTGATADSEIDSASEYIASVIGFWPATTAYPFGSTIYANAVDRCKMIFGLVQQPHDKADDWIAQAIENYYNRLAVPRIKVFNWITKEFLLYELTHLNQQLAAVKTPGPTDNPTINPTVGPTQNPTAKPTEGPTLSPNPTLTPGPTAGPTPAPTENPTPAPTEAPTVAPTASPAIIAAMLTRRKEELPKAA